MEREWLNTLSLVPYVKDLMNVSQIDVCRLSSTCSNLVSSTNKIPLYFVELKSQDHSKLQYQRFLLLTCDLPISVLSEPETGVDKLCLKSRVGENLS